MKNKISIIFYSMIMFLTLGATNVMAQSNDDNQNNQNYNQQPPPPPSDQNYNNQDPNYNQDQDQQQYDQNGNGNGNDQYNQNNDQDNQDYTNDGNNDGNGSGDSQDYNKGYNDGSNAQAQADVNMNDFTQALSPYGSWIDYPGYGQVWVCGIRGFRPYYSGGHWVYTNFGWTWASDYAWGWAPFHYGRWAYEAMYGWMWVPGYQWGPAWVGWRTGGSYYGWAPLAPGIRIGIGGGFGGYGYIPAERWCFVQHGYLGNRYVGRYVINPARNYTIIRNTTIINNVHTYGRGAIVNGPARADVERYTGRPIQPMHVVTNVRPGAAVANGNTLGIYRPHAAINTNRTNQVNMQRNVQPAYQNGVQHNMNNLPQRNNFNAPVNRQPVNQSPAPQRNVPNNMPQRPNAAPQQQRTPGASSYEQPRNYQQPARAYAPQQTQRNYAPAQRGFASQSFERQNFGGGFRRR